MNAASGTIVSRLVLTAAPDDALPLPTLASALVAALRTEAAEAEAELEVAELLLVLEPEAEDPAIVVVAGAVVVVDCIAETAAGFDEEPDDVGVPATVTVPGSAFVVCVPLAVPPDVLT